MTVATRNPNTAGAIRSDTRGRVLVAVNAVGLAVSPVGPASGQLRLRVDDAQDMIRLSSFDRIEPGHQRGHGGLHVVPGTDLPAIDGQGTVVLWIRPIDVTHF